MGFPGLALVYPFYLIPDNHTQTQKQNSSVELSFGSTPPAHPNELQTITIDGVPSPDVYLEPELVATMAKGSGKKEIRTYLTFDQIPSMVWKAIIAVEDQHFLEHKGLDPRGIARAIWVNLKTLSFAQGGSTITQQLVKNLMARRTKNIFRKLNELFLSLLLELRFEKEQILERYLNEVYLGQVGSLEIHGVAEGAEHFFGKKIEDLNLAEIALMAGLIRGPGYYSPYRERERAIERQKLVIKKMVETGLIAEEEALVTLKLPIRLAPPQTSLTKAPFFSDYVKAELLTLLKDRVSEQQLAQAGLRVYTTLNLRLNAIAQRSVSNGISQLEGRFKLPETQSLEGALASVDHSNGFIRVLVGGKNYAKSNFNRILNMKRQIGSTFKPFVYLAAYTKGRDPQGVPYGPGHPAYDGPWTWIYDHEKQNWAPRNYEKEFMGWVSLRGALAHSINTVAARLASEVGLSSIVDIAQKLGIKSKLPAVPSLSLGVAELSPIELLQAYATLANRGNRLDPVVIRGITKSDGTNYIRTVSPAEQVIDPAPIDLLTDTLQDVFSHGTAQAARKLGFDRPAAGKTGTTSHHRDAWFAGYTPRLTTVAWVGMDQGSSNATPPVVLTGANSALPIWVEFMKAAHSGEPSIPFLDSPLLVGVLIDHHTGKVAKSDCPSTQIGIEKFIKGTVPMNTSCEPNWPPTPPPTVKE